MQTTNGVKFLGVDYGTKRIGLAVSDEKGLLAFPRDVIPNSADVFNRLREVMEPEHIDEIVVGESLNFSGAPNKLMENIKNFTEKLEVKFSLPVHVEKEFLTSVEARRYGVKNGKRVDASAAALILQRYLDRRNNVV